MSLAVNYAVLDGQPAGLGAEHGVIVEVGPGVLARPEDDRLDAAGAILTPGL